MNKVVARQDDFNKRREEIKSLSDKELKEKFWELADKIVKPLVDLSYKNTSPAIERSVLLRMGFSSIEAKNIIERLESLELLTFGAGHCVYIIHKEKNVSIRQSGLEIIEGKHLDDILKYFNVEVK